MAIKKSAYSSIKLTGNEAKEFIVWVENGAPSKEAIKTMKDGEKLASEFERNGFIKFYPNK